MHHVFKLLLGALVLGWCAQAPALAEAPMAFFMKTAATDRMAAKMVKGYEEIYASGEITEGTTERFFTFVRQNKVQAAKVVFNSPGGSLAEGMKLGRAIRTLEFMTTIGTYTAKFDDKVYASSICASACAYAFAGGTSRFLDQYTGRLGVHQFYTSDNEAVSGEVVQQVSGLIVAFLDEMGIDAKAFAVSTVADRNGMIWLTPDEALSLRFANNGTTPPTVEIKLANMVPYLRVQQERQNVTVRILFFCERKEMGMQFGIVSDPTSSAMFAENQRRSYLELDHKEFLVVAGTKGGVANDSVTWINRMLAPTELLSILKANELSGWIDGYGAVRYGGTLDMATVRGPAAGFAKQCYGA